MATYCKNCLNPLALGDARHGDSVCVLPLAIPAGDTRQEYIAWLHRQAKENGESIPVIILPSHLKRYEEEDGWALHTCSKCGLSFSYRVAASERPGWEENGVGCFFCGKFDPF